MPTSSELMSWRARRSKRQRPKRSSRALAPARAPHQRLQARDQFARLEGLGEVVVGAQLQPDDAAHRVAARGQHQHRRRVGLGAQPAQQRQAVLAGQHQVQHDGIGPGGRQQPPHRPAVRRGADLPAEALQVGRQAGPDLGVVVDDEAMHHAEVLAGFMRRCPPVAWRRSRR
jgi:hypothetical protein